MAANFAAIRMIEPGRSDDEPAETAAPAPGGHPICARCASLRAVAGFLAAGLLAAASDGSAQTPVCSSSPSTGQRIECSEGAGSTEDIVIDAADVGISTVDRETHGIHGLHRGRGDVRISVRGGSVTTGDDESRGVFGVVDTGAVGDVTVEIGNASVRTTGADATAVGASNRGTGSVYVQLRGSRIATTRNGSWGVQSSLAGRGDVRLALSEGTEVSTTGDDAHGLILFTTGAADESTSVHATVRDSRVMTSGDSAFGLFVQQGRPRGAGAGPIRVDLSNATVETAGADSHALYADQRSVAGVGNVTVILDGARLATEGADSDPNDRTDTFSFGILARQYGTGDVVIDLRDAGMATKGSSSHGAYGIHSFGSVRTNEGDVIIGVRDGSTITTEGRSAHGIVGYHLGTLDRRTIAIDVDRSVVVSRGDGADAIRVGRLDGSGEVERAAGLGADGYRRQTVRVNGRVLGGAAGIHLAGGGRIAIGPLSRVGAISGIAILADGDTIVDGETLVRRLRVDLLPDGGRVSDLLDGIVGNDSGETVVAVNGIVVYDDGGDGATDLWAPNGARDVRLQDGFTGLDFSSADVWVDRYASRAAVYEALPGFLMRLHGRTGAGPRRMRAPETPVWVRLTGGAGSYEARSSSVGAGYDFDRVAVEVRADVRMDGELTGSIGFRTVSGSADVSASTGGGGIGASGQGLTLGLVREGRNGLYGAGGIAATWLGVDMESGTRGGLRSGVDAFVHALDAEVGQRFALSETTALISRVWLSRSGVSVKSFRDAVGARVSVRDTNRVAGGLGATIESDPVRNGKTGEAMLFGSLDVVRTLGGGETTVLVSGEELRSGSPNTGIHVGVGGTWRWDCVSLDGAIRAHGVRSGDTEYQGRLDLRIAF